MRFGTSSLPLHQPEGGAGPRFCRRGAARDRWLRRGRKTHKLLSIGARPGAMLMGSGRIGTLSKPSMCGRVSLVPTAESLRRQGPRAASRFACVREAPAFARAREEQAETLHPPARTPRPPKGYSDDRPKHERPASHARHGPKGRGPPLFSSMFFGWSERRKDRALTERAGLYVGFGAGSRVTSID